ncbi:uncharacterized protein LOC118438300 [Folsomia candida]|uniref:uncharacterized protein LOC118438300 n=1 Tax=Folsomia candida TaxID=158441 RepID=UPI00160535EF|nr:uncharacterized protein LOC118438300 [Folsomia candida]
MQVESDLSTQQMDDKDVATSVGDTMQVIDSHLSIPLIDDILDADDTTQGESGDLQIDETNVATSALMNPLLLNLIFSYMDARRLKKSVRPVCTLWADLGAPFLGKKTKLTFSEHTTCDTWRKLHS